MPVEDAERHGRRQRLRFQSGGDRVSCTPAEGCGIQGVFSEYGSYPSWSPYQGTTVEKNITFKQDNHFEDNTYQGPWSFMALQLGNFVSGSRWRDLYGEDETSTLSRKAAT